MFMSLALKLSELSPWFKRLLWRRWYQYLAGYKQPDWRFMNYGYAPLNLAAPRFDLRPEDEPNRFAIELYRQVAGAVPLGGLDVLEVGSGRGGGAAFVQRYLGPKHMTGLDVSAKAIRFCRRTYGARGLSFVQGDAESLPFGAEEFDAVVNVESSHCYGSMPAFLAEVKRVLRGGGHFLFADLRGAADLEHLERRLLESGLAILEQEDITANVLAALQLDSERKWALIERSVAQRWRGVFREFAAIEGSKIYAGFRDGAVVYRRYLLRK
jgi:SAM-dependent methyltransferase